MYMKNVPNVKTEAELHTLIESGFFYDYYFIYNRKSTDDTDSQKNSIKYQKAFNLRFSFDEKIQLAPLTIAGFCTDGIISERHSAFAENELLEIIDGKVTFRIERPKFQRMSEWLLKKYFKGVIFLCWDRASRNKGDNLILDRLSKAGCELHFALTKYDKGSSGELHKDVDSMMSAHVSRVTSEKVTLTQKNNRDMGICTYKAPVGYLNQGTMEWKPIDPVRGPIVTQLFQMYATGEWSLHALAKWANDQGFTMPPSRRRRTQEEILAEEEDDIRLQIEAVARPVEYKQISRILKNRSYLQEVKGNDGEWIKTTSYDSLIDEATFDKVQIMLDKKKVSQHYVEVLDTAYRGMVRCLECNRVYTPYMKKEKHLFLGAKCVAGCENTDKNIASAIFEGVVGDLLQKLTFTDDELEEIDSSLHTDIAILELKKSKEIAKIEQRKKKLREDLAYLRTNKLSLMKSGVYSPEEYLFEEEKVNTELNRLVLQEVASDKKVSDAVKDIIKLSELLKDTYLYYSNAKPHEKQDIIRIIFSELKYSSKGLEYKCKNGFLPLQNRFETICDLTENRTPLPSLRRMCPNR